MLEINKIYNENCLDTMKNMPNNFVDLVITSPPYDSLRAYDGFYFDFEKIAKEVYRVVRDGGVVVWVVADQTIKGSESGTSFKQVLFFKDIGFNLHDTMIYAKKNYMPLTHRRYEQQFEYMFILSKGKPKTFNPIMIPTKNPKKITDRSTVKSSEKTYCERLREECTITKETKQMPNIWYYAVGQGDKVKHNAPFPEQLARDHIISWSNKGDLIYDPFMGSGTTAKMAILENRNFVGSEISLRYVEEAEKRIGGLSNER